MRTVFKYTLEPTGMVQKIEMPAGARLLKFDTQRGALTIWALVNPEDKPASRFFRVVGTGHQILEDHVSYVGTIQQLGAALVWHLFEVNV